MPPPSLYSGCASSFSATSTSSTNRGPTHLHVASCASFRGVRKRSWGKWVAEIRQPRKRSRIWLGSYFSPEAAARAFDVASFCLRGPAARMNLPDALPSVVRNLSFPSPKSPNLPLLSPKSVQKVALEAGSLADSSASAVGLVSSSYSTVASSDITATHTASTSCEVLPPISSSVSVAPGPKLEKTGARSANCRPDLHCTAHPQVSQSNPQTLPEISSVTTPFSNSILRGRRGEAASKPPRLSIAARDRKEIASGTVGSMNSELWSSASTNAPLQNRQREQPTATTKAVSVGSPTVAWRVNHASAVNGAMQENVAGFSWLDRAKLDISPNPTIEQIADAMLLLPPAETTHSSKQQQQQPHCASATGYVAGQQQLPPDSCDEFVYEDEHHHIPDASLWNLF